jgi:hypothetical protein
MYISDKETRDHISAIENLREHGHAALASGMQETDGL